MEILESSQIFTLRVVNVRFWSRIHCFNEDFDILILNTTLQIISLINYKQLIVIEYANNNRYCFFIEYSDCGCDRPANS